MKISKNERRILERRQKDRVPPYMLAKLSRVPKLVLVVACSIWLTPYAYSQVKSDANAIIVAPTAGIVTPQAGQFTKTYSKEELNQKHAPENPVRSLGSVLHEHLSSYLKTVGDMQGKGLNDLNTKQKLRSKEDFTYMAAAMRDDKMRSRLDSEALRNHMQGQSRKAVSKEVIRKSDMIQSMKQGLNFDLDLASIFSKKNKKSNVASTSGSVRYGLIVRDINPGNGGQSRAAIGDSSEDQLMYAGQAEVLYTIGPVDDEAGTPLNIVNKHDVVGEEPKSVSFLDYFTLPSMKFKGNVVTATDDLEQIKDYKGVPDLTFNVTQVENLYQLTYSTGENLEHKSTTHQFNVPIIGELKLGRRYDDKFQVVETSAYNILIDKKMPSVNVAYMNQEDRYEGSVSKAINKGGDISAKVNVPRNKEKVKKEHREEKYKIEYNIKF